MHAALFYRDHDEYLREIVGFVRAGRDDGDAVLVTLPSGNLELLRAALGDADDQVVLSDMSEVGRNPARTFGLFAGLCREYAGRRIRMVAEPVWPGGRSQLEYPACVQNEALWNSAFADYDVLTLCPYDATGLSATVLSDARLTHPWIWRAGVPVPSSDYNGTDAYQRYNTPLPTDSGAATLTLDALEDLRPAREFVSRHAAAAGLGDERTGDLQLIVSELATNSLLYTVGGCRLALWTADGLLVCQVIDSGRLENPLAGRLLPDPEATGGRGLYLVNALADLVRIHAGPAGTTIEVHLRLPG